MEREIKFRAKSNGRWVYGHYYNNKSYAVNTDYIVSDVGKTDGEHFIVDGSTLGEFTGLFDKSGEPIFEGDIIKDHVYGVSYVCKFEEGMFGFHSKDGRYFNSESLQVNTGKLDYSWIEIIGNIHTEQK